MNQPASVFFTGMDASDAEQLAALFQEINRRSGNRWTLAGDADSASVLVIDVDTLYGHMTWLRAQSSGQTIVALTGGETADADHVLSRPVTAEAMRRVLHGLSAAHPPTSAPSEPAPVPAPPPAARAAETITDAAPAPAKAPEAQTPPAVERPAPVPVQTPVPDRPTGRRLIDLMLSGEAGDGPCRLELPGLPPLLFDLTRKVFLCSSGIKTYLPHAQAILGNGAIERISNDEFDTRRREIGDAQPIGRLLWLAALGGSGGEIPGAAPDARYRLNKWPQIEREFPRHFRIATAMMKGFQAPSELAEQSGAAVAEVNDFIAASLVSGHAEVEAPASAEAAAPAQKSLLERLRGAR